MTPAQELLLPLLLNLVLILVPILILTHALPLNHQLPDAPIPLVLLHIPVLHVVTPRVLVNQCLLQLVTGLTNVRKKFYFSFHCYLLTAFWMNLGFPKLVTVRAQPQT